MKRKLLSILLAGILMFLLVPVTALAATGDPHTEGDYTVQELADGTAEIVSYTGSASGHLDIPSTVAGYTVTVIKSGFSGKGMTSVTVPEGVKEIGDGAFSSCTSLASITLPSTLKTLGTSVFINCTALETIALPSGLETIGDSVFNNCSHLSTVTMGNNVTSIGPAAFAGCTALSSITLSTKLTSISTYTFQDSGLTSITIPPNVESIGQQAFMGSHLSSVTLNEGLKTIRADAFFSLPLTQVVIPESTTSIGSTAFGNCTSLTKAVFLSPTVTIGAYAFVDAPFSDGIYGFAGSTAEALAGSSFTFQTIYKVIYDSKGGSDVDYGYTVSGGTIDKPADPTQSGYIFSGWYDNDSYTGNAVSFPYTVTGNGTLYAKWLAACAVTFEANGGSAVAAQTVGAGQKVTKPADPTRSGYVFGGWYADSALTDAWDFAADTVSGPTTLYAKWTQPSLSSSEPSGKIYVGGRIILTPNVEGGTWGYDKSFFSATFNSPATFTAMKAGKSTITYTVGGLETKYEVTIEAAALPETGQDYAAVYWVGTLAVLAAAAALIVKKRAARQ